MATLLRQLGDHPAAAAAPPSSNSSPGLRPASPPSSSRAPKQTPHGDLPEAALYSLCANFTIPYAALAMLVSGTQPPPRRVSLLRLLSPALEPLSLNEVIAILDVIPISTMGPPLRYHAMVFLSRALPSSISEQDVLSLLLALPAASRPDALHFVLRNLPAATTLMISATYFYHILKALAPERRLVGIEVMKDRLQPFTFTFEQFVPFVKFIPPPQRVGMLNAIPEHIPQLASGEIVLSVLAQIPDTMSKIAAFMALSQRLSPSLRWDDVPQLLREFSVPDRLLAVARLSQVITAPPTPDQVAGVIATFPDSSTGAEFSAKALSAMAQRLKGSSLTPDELVTFITLIPAKNRSVVVPAFVSHLRALSAEDLIPVLGYFPENYNHRMDALTGLRVRLAPLSADDLVRLIECFESKGGQLACLEALINHVDELEEDIVLAAFSTQDRKKAQEILKRRGR